MAKLTHSQVAQMLTGLNVIIAKVQESDEDTYDTAQYSEDALGKSYGIGAEAGVSARYENKFEAVFGFKPNSFDSFTYEDGLTKLQAKLTKLFTTTIAQNRSLFSARISKEDWLDAANEVRKDLEKALAKRQAQNIM